MSTLRLVELMAHRTARQRGEGDGDTCKLRGVSSGMLCSVRTTKYKKSTYNVLLWCKKYGRIHLNFCKKSTRRIRQR